MFVPFLNTSIAGPSKKCVNVSIGMSGCLLLVESLHGQEMKMIPVTSMVSAFILIEKKFTSSLAVPPGTLQISWTFLPFGGN